MRIVSWNCNGALRNKVAQLDALDADLIIVQECEDPTGSSSRYRDWAGSYLWKGTSQHKGIGIFPKKGNTVSALGWCGSFSLAGAVGACPASSWTTKELELFLPFKLNDQITMLGVWTKGDDNRVFSYIGQVWKYLCIHHSDVSDLSTMVLGDFNSNAIWDKPDRWWNHSDVVTKLAAAGLKSLYHEQHISKHGKESHPTLFLQRNRTKQYHVDYAFVSKDLLPKSRLTIGLAEDWLLCSDHVPLVVDISE